MSLSHFVTELHQRRCFTVGEVSLHLKVPYEATVWQLCLNVQLLPLCDITKSTGTSPCLETTSHPLLSYVISRFCSVTICNFIFSTFPCKHTGCEQAVCCDTRTPAPRLTSDLAAHLIHTPPRPPDSTVMTSPGDSEVSAFLRFCGCRVNVAAQQ